MITYSQRRNLFEKSEWTYTVRDDGLLVRDQRGHETLLAWGDVAAVRISYAPSRSKSWRHVLVLTMRNRVRWEIDNTHFKGIADFENRSASYTPFVQAVIAQLAAKSPAAEARLGAQPISYWFSVLSLSLLFLILGSVLVSVPIGGIPGIAWVKLAIILVMLPVLVLWAKRAYPREVKLDAIPESALPKSGAA